jgi:hypothetical protein
MADEQNYGRPVRDALSGFFMGGPVGLLMGPSILKDARERRALQNAQLRDSIAARDELTDLLGRQVEVPRNAPPAAGQQPQLWQNPAMPGPRPQASPIAGPGGFDAVPEYATPQGQQRVMQLMSRMSPEGAMKVGESLIPGLSQRTSAIIGDMDALGLPRTMENYQRISATKGGSSNPIEMALAAALLQQREGANLAAEEERERERKERTAEENEFINNLTVSGDSLMDLARVNSRLMNREGLSGYLAKPGLPFAQRRRDVLTGWDEDAAADIDSFNSLANQIAISRLSTESFDGNTNARFSAFTSTKPTFEAVGPANYLTIMKNLEGVLLADEAKGFVLSPERRSKYKREVERLRGLTRGAGDGQQTRSVTLPDGRIVDNVPANVTDEQLIQWLRSQGG